MMIKALKDNTIVYRIVRQIAEGGMGAVYEAIQDGSNGFQKTVAVKTLLPQLSEDVSFVNMFVQEAKLVANLVHENIVQIYHLGRSTDGYFFVMEYVNGLSLHEFIRFHNLMKMRTPLPLAVFICSRIARGLAYAHVRNNDFGEPLKIVHRDVCPNNILVTTEGLPKLADFGIAVIASERSLLNANSIVGKLHYMSPEQANRKSVDFRADIFALGAVLFELLSGARIRDGETQEELYGLARTGTVDWDKLPEDVPDDVRLILQRALASDPNERYESTAEMARDLEFFIYKDGYGPTIQTLEKYLSKEFAYLYHVNKKKLTRLAELAGTSRPPAVPPEATIIME